MVRSVAARAGQQRSADSGALIVRWWRPTLAIAASLALLAWAPSLFSSASTELDAASTAGSTSDSALTLLSWASASDSSSMGRTP